MLWVVLKGTSGNIYEGVKGHSLGGACRSKSSDVTPTLEIIEEVNLDGKIADAVSLLLSTTILGS